MSIIIKAHYDGKAIVPEAELDLPADQPLEVQLRLVTPDETASASSRPAECSKPDITLLPFFGMWAGRDDMADSAAWVRKEREKWTSRLSATSE